MTTTKPQPQTRPQKRKPSRFQMAFLFMFHGVITAAVLLTYISGDDIYFLHQFAGYVVCVAILVRLLAATLAPNHSPLSLSLPPLFAKRSGGRSPIWKWMAVALIAVIAAAAFTGLLAESIGFDDLHEGLAEGVLPMFIFGHMALVLWRPLGRKLGNVSAEDIDRTVNQTSAVVSTLAEQTYSAARRLKPYLQSNR